MKNAEKLLEAMGSIDDDLVMEAKAPRKWRHWAGWAAAACAAAALLAGVMGKQNTPSREIDPDLPKLSVQFEESAQGFEGLMFYDIAESGDANPWTGDAELDKLPVYRNLAYSGIAGAPVYLTEDAMLALAQETANALGETITSTKTEKIGGALYRLHGETETGYIQVDGNGDIRIAFTEGAELPEGYRLADGASREKAEAALLWLVDRYSAVTGLADPAADIWTDYTFSGSPSTRYKAYSMGADLTESILNYNFSYVSFSGAYSGKVQYIDIRDRLSTAELIGEYPILTVEEAREKLLKGEYLTTVPSDCLPEGKITADRIAKTELVYRTGSGEETYMPYYRFYVAIQEENVTMAAGLQNYGVYYVPAVWEEYLTDIPVWDGSFN